MEQIDDASVLRLARGLPALRRWVVRRVADARLARWRRRTYEPFVWSERRRVFLGVARHWLLNSAPATPGKHTRSWATGYYFEFGCYRARTMRVAFDTFRHAFDWTYVAFDSFAGFPKVSAEESQGGIWQEGDLATSEEEFVRLCVRHGMPRERLVTVPGYYDESLTPELQQRLLPDPARVVYIDCDLYSSTVPVLAFVEPFLRVGSVIVFDDWFLYHGNPEEGQRRAFAEFRARNPHLRFEPLLGTGEFQAFVVVAVANRGRADVGDDGR